MKKKICITLGTRPEIIRLATIINELRADKTVDFKLVYTGQHYDFLMKDVFFKELNLSLPDVDLKIGSGTHTQQTAGIMLGVEKYFNNNRPDIVAVFGDTNSSLAVALTAVKMKIPLAHMEAGCREWEMDKPEEINRRLIDHCANILMPVSQNCVDLLKKEKVLGDIVNTGDPQYEVFKKMLPYTSIRPLKKLNLDEGEYVFMTIHRDKSVDNLENLKTILNAVSSYKEYPIVFSIHPRTKKMLKKIKGKDVDLTNFILLDPLPYIDTLSFVKNAKFVITDSGGLQKEVFWCKVPGITILDHTCWKETVDLGVNFLTPINKKSIEKIINYIASNEDKIRNIFKKIQNPYYKPKITKVTVALLKKYAGKSWEKNKI